MKPVYIKIDENDDRFYYSDREMTVRHREDGPAVEYADGSIAWYLNGKLHREDGPAFEGVNGYKSWYLNGKRVTEQDHTRLTQKELTLTLDEIAEKFGIAVDKLKIQK
jgi:hypothetical protein